MELLPEHDEMLEVIVGDNVGRVLPVLERHRPAAPVCSVCLFTPQDADFTTVFTCNEVAVISEPDRETAIATLAGEERLVAAWTAAEGLGLALTSIEAPQSAKAEELSPRLFDALRLIADRDQDPDRSPQRFVMDRVANRLTAQQAIGPATHDFVVYFDIEGDITGSLYRSLKVAASEEVFATLQARGLAPLGPEAESASGR